MLSYLLGCLLLSLKHCHFSLNNNIDTGMRPVMIIQKMVRKSERHCPTYDYPEFDFEVH